MNLRSLTNLLEANLREELAAKTEVLRLIEAQEEAAARSDMDAFEAGLESMKAHLAADRRRETKRAKVMQRLGETWGVAADALTLGSVAIRLGADGEVLSGLRTELKARVEELAQRNRRLSAVLGMHRRLNQDVMNVVFGAEGGADPTEAGSLVDARA